MRSILGNEHANMPAANEVALNGRPQADLTSSTDSSAQIVEKIKLWLDDAKAEDIVTISLEGKSSIGDYMVIATGRTDRHVGAVAEQIRTKLKENGLGHVRIEGTEQCDWVLIDTGDIIVHLFRPEVRAFYNLERMWSTERPPDQSSH
ncbi:MAG: ribosome silencing factor [Pseudomonadota bacterium]